eukprot:scaffold14344_cov69-Phaeocystis_antarctica.AAC.4
MHTCTAHARHTHGTCTAHARVCAPAGADGLKGTLVTFPLLMWVFGGVWLVLGMLGLIAVKRVLDFGEFGAVDHVHTPSGLASSDEAVSGAAYIL